jgi:hypothetical protein
MGQANKPVSLYSVHTVHCTQCTLYTMYNEKCSMYNVASGKSSPVGEVFKIHNLKLQVLVVPWWSLISQYTNRFSSNIIINKFTHIQKKS